MRYSVRFLDNGWYVLELGGMCAMKVSGPWHNEATAQWQLEYILKDNKND
jgi:hypothetical protein